MAQKTPLYEIIYNDIKEAIESGRFCVGDKIPSEKSLMDQYKVSRITAIRALEELEKDGYIERRWGSGNFVILKKGQEYSLLQNNTNMKCRLIGVVVPFLLRFDSSQPEHFDYVQGVNDYLNETEFRAVLYTRKEVWDERNLLLRAYKDGCEGIIYYPLKLEYTTDIIYQMTEKKYPIAIIDQTLENMPVVCVGTKNKEALYELTNYLIDKGHKKIGFMTYEGVGTINTVYDRYRGYCSAMNDAGLELDLNATIMLIKDDNREIKGYNTASDEETLELVYDGIKKILDAGCTALCSENDILAGNIIKACEKYGVKVPEQLAVAGFDNLIISQYTNPPLTTIAQDFFHIGRLAAVELCKKIDNNDAECKKISIPATLIARGSA